MTYKEAHNELYNILLALDRDDNEEKRLYDAINKALIALEFMESIYQSNLADKILGEEKEEESPSDSDNTDWWTQTDDGDDVEMIVRGNSSTKGSQYGKSKCCSC